MTDDIFVLYDGECPLCRNGVHYYRIREAAGSLTLVDARTEPGHPVMLEAKARGLSVDDGMIAKYEGAF